MLDTVIKLLPGQVVNGFRIEGYCDRDNKNLPVYRVRCTRCDTQTTMSHRRPYATKCTHCEIQATRATLAQPPNITAKLNEIRSYDAQVDADYAARKVDPEVPQAPQPKPVKSLSRLARIAIEEARLRGWSWDDVQQAKLEEL